MHGLTIRLPEVSEELIASIFKVEELVRQETYKYISRQQV
jgi:hypothetical protein